MMVGRLGDWDKVEKRKRVTTQQDIVNEYIKAVIWFIAGYVYFHFIIMGWSI
tara:strand:- start:163 stop:318 length:156 start_codon:yes stop_codon:yes gene_type:complete